MTTLILRKGAERRLRGGHLWIYSNEIDSDRTPIGEFAPGDCVSVQSAGGDLLGSAYMEPASLICARLYARAEERQLDEAFFVRRVSTALRLRERLYSTGCYRLIYGDSDGLPGIVVDRFREHLVVQLNQPGLERYSDALVAALVSQVQPAGILLRGDSRSRREQGLDDSSVVAWGEVPEWVELEENGVQFVAPVLSGQKTGWFYDHRLSRGRLAAHAADRSVLDVYSYIGGWGIQAAVAGASHVTCVDSSAAALDGVTRNAELNNVAGRVSTERGSATQVLQALHAAGQQFDIVVLDPPAFVQRRRALKKGIAAYRRINEMALRLLPEDGLLVSASCSMQLPRADLVSALRQASVRAQVDVQIIEQGGQGPDHPIHPAIVETEYLKTLFVRRVS